MPNKQTIKEVEENWCKNGTISEEWRVHYHQTGVDYLESKGKEPDEVTATTDICKAMFPYFVFKIDA